MQPIKLDRYDDDGDEFTVVNYECSGAIENDAFFAHMVEMARSVYGEYLLDELTDIAPSVAESFDLNAIKSAIRKGMPNPQDEANKPLSLANYRSEAAELIAKKALIDSYGFLFPASAQVTKGNASQPVLGFDGWGLMEISSNVWAFVVIQVKGSDENKSPPTVAEQLFDECMNAPSDTGKICRALVSIQALIRDSQISSIILRMLESIGNNKKIRLIVAPVIVRGKIASQFNDICHLGKAISSTEIMTKASTAYIGIELDTFGQALFEKARSDG